MKTGEREIESGREREASWETGLRTFYLCFLSKTPLIYLPHLWQFHMDLGIGNNRVWTEDAGDHLSPEVALEGRFSELLLEGFVHTDRHAHKPPSAPGEPCHQAITRVPLRDEGVVLHPCGGVRGQARATHTSN